MNRVRGRREKVVWVWGYGWVLGLELVRWVWVNVLPVMMKTWLMKGVMAMVPVCALMVASAAAEDVKVEMPGGISTTTHEKAPLAVRRREALLENREPRDGDVEGKYGSYELKWTATLLDRREEQKEVSGAMLTLKVWVPVRMRFPGWNAPVVEIWSGENRLGCQVLNEVGWPLDAWSAMDRKEGYLYVKTRHRHRFANGECVYELDAKGMKLVYKGVFFSREELVREAAEVKGAGE